MDDILIDKPKKERICTCDWCVKEYPMIKSIFALLNDEQKEYLDDVYEKLEMASTDSVFWEMKFRGTWPSTTVEDIKYHIKMLEDRIVELTKEEEK